MSLDHHFLLVDRTAGPPPSGREIRARGIAIHDHVLRYFADALAWVPTENPAKGGETGMGLNFWGPTVVSQRGADKLRDVCAAWAGLLALGPSTLRLRGLYSFPADDPQAGAYETLELDRDELVGKLRQLAAWADTVSRSSRHYLLHEGV